MFRLSTDTNEIDQAIAPIAEAVFPVVPGAKISSMHGYSLYSALKGVFPWLEDCPLTAIATIAGIPDENRGIEIVEWSRLRIRVPLAKASALYGLAGKKLQIGQGRIALKTPEILPLRLKPKLRARIVTIKLKPRSNSPSPDRFLAVATRQLEERGIRGRPSIIVKNGELDSKALIIKGHKIPGYGMEVRNLTEEDSLKLQTLGLGGRRKMGAGFFL
ncbi:MAG: type I-MYXAN CRISPR-associated protein Cas6/Cmx6 [Cyanobacteria bacterium P01_E01_bin.42]